ncbi:MAG: hypothetical protein CL928_13560 [Deltaproteobacteria bacterium]|nr:hypothetical protein [Deltaproteobacteria bacterium]
MNNTKVARVLSSVAVAVGLCVVQGCGSAWQPELSNSRALEDVPEYTEEGPLGWGDEESEDTATDAVDDNMDSSEGPGAGGEAGVVALEPAPDSTTHHYRAPLLVTFDSDATGATVTLSGPTAGEPDHVIPTDVRWNDLNTVASVHPGVFLLPSSSYTVTLDVGDARLDYSFTTSSVGGPLDEGASVEGRTYALSLQDASLVSPVGLSALVSQLPSSLVWLWGVEAGAYEDELSISVAMGEGVDDGFVQDQCVDARPLGGGVASVELDRSYFSNPSGDLEILVGSQLLVLEEGWIDGDFAADATSLLQVGLRGWLRASDLADIAPDSGEVCDWLASELTTDCDSCPSGTGRCLWVEVGGLSGTETSLELVAEADEQESEDLDDSASDGGDVPGTTGDPDGTGGTDTSPPDDEDCGSPQYDPFACSIGANAQPSGMTLLLLLSCGALSLRSRRHP